MPWTMEEVGVAPLTKKKKEEQQEQQNQEEGSPTPILSRPSRRQPGTQQRGAVPGTRPTEVGHPDARCVHDSNNNNGNNTSNTSNSNTATPSSGTPTGLACLCSAHAWHPWRGTLLQRPVTTPTPVARHPLHRRVALTRQVVAPTAAAVAAVVVAAVAAHHSAPVDHVGEEGHAGGVRAVCRRQGGGESVVRRPCHRRSDQTLLDDLGASVHVQMHL